MKILNSFFRHCKLSLKSKEKILFVCIFCLFAVSVFAEKKSEDKSENKSTQNEVTTITISNARQTTYRKDPITGNDTIVLEGSVELSVEKGSTSSEIKADKITYDRKTEMLYAEGNVAIITKTSSSGGETTTASALLMNTATLEGAFDDGRIVQTQSDALNLPSGSTLIVFSDIFGKSESNTIAFKDSRLTFCDDEDPHWRINASRTWLLPGGEFAFLNAFLFVGSVPVLYLPAFYYPKDELVYNPVFAYNRREGYSVQNTLYLYGRKPLDTSSSSSSSSSSTSDSSDAAESLKALYNFMKPSTLKEQKLEGLMLHNLDENYTGNTSDYIKVMGDWYSNLGGMVGLAGNLSPAPSYISKLSFNTYLGFSHTIFLNEEEYQVYHPVSGRIYDDASTFLGVSMPFRYSGDLQFGISKPFRLSISLPFYSDPFFSYDFKDSRRETMDWISYLLDSTTKDTSTITISEISSFTWALSSSWSPTMPNFIKPFVSSLSMSMNSSVVISSQNADKDALLASHNTEEVVMDSDWVTYTPSRKFYYPSQITPGNVSMSLSGTIFQYPKTAVSSSSNSQSYPVALTKPQELKKPSEIEKELEEAEKKAREEAEKNNPSENSDDSNKEDDESESDEIDFSEWVQPALPDLSFTASTETLATGFTYKLGYSVAPSLVTQVSYASSNLKKSEDFDWSNIRSFMYTVKVPTSLTSTLNYGGSFFGLTNKISYDPVFQKHPVISMDEDEGGYTSSSKKSLILADYNAESQNVSNTNNVSFYPFYYTKHFSETGISWDSSIKLYRKKFIGDADNPEWEEYALDLDNEDCVTVNSINLKLGTSQLSDKFKQSLTFSSVLPPLLRQYTGTLNLTFPYVTASFGTGYVEQTHDDVVEKSEKWKLNPLQQSLTVSVLNNKLKFSESFNYSMVDPEDKHPDSLKLTTSWNSLNLSYVMSHTLGYDPDDEEGWKVREEKEFLPYSLSFSYAPSTKTFYTWFNRISMAPGVNTSIVADLLRPTNSYFLFSPSLTFKINEFFSLTFSSTSRNSVLYRYIQKSLGYDGRIPGEQNIFIDLINSYRFDDIMKRKGSGFKLKSLDLTMSHELHDWKFNLTYKVEPKLIYKTSTSSYTYDFTPNITIGIVWNPMESIKTNLKFKYDEDEEKGLWSLE